MQTTTTKTHEPNNNKSITSSSQLHKGGKGTYILAPEFNNYFRKQIFDKNRNSINSLATSLPHYSEQKTKKQKRKKKKRYPGSLQFKTSLHKAWKALCISKPRTPKTDNTCTQTNKAKQNKQASKAQTPYLQLQNNFQLKNNYYYYSVSTTHNAQMQTKSSSPP